MCANDYIKSCRNFWKSLAKCQKKLYNSS